MNLTVSDVKRMQDRMTLRELQTYRERNHHTPVSRFVSNRDQNPGNNALSSEARKVAKKIGLPIPTTAAERLTQQRASGLGWSEKQWRRVERIAKKRIAKKTIIVAKAKGDERTENIRLFLAAQKAGQRNKLRGGAKRTRRSVNHTERAEANRAFIFRVANGCCMACGRKVPLNMNGDPLLFSHHFIGRGIAANGIDNIFAVAAVCGWCHPIGDNGENRKEFNKTLLQKAGVKLQKFLKKWRLQ